MQHWQVSMVVSWSRRLALSGIALAVLLLMPAIGTARTPLAVDLIRFELRTVDNGVHIEWETGTEQDVAYFLIKRSTSPEGPFVELPDIGLIAAEGSTFAGATYTVVDETVLPAQDYTYQLYEITLSNSEDLVASATISLEPTPTPEIIGGGSGGGATSTPAPTSTRSGGNPTTPTANATTSLTTSPVATSGTVAVTQTGETGATATRAFPVLGPTPTRFSFTPRSPVSTGYQTATGVVEAAGPSLVAQVTPEAYPGSQSTVAITPLDPATQTDTTLAPRAYPLLGNPGEGDSLDVLPNSVGQAQDANGSDPASAATSAAAETSGGTRLLLWLGFLGALSIFIGGIAVSIILSTRRRDSGPF